MDQAEADCCAPKNGMSEHARKRAERERNKEDRQTQIYNTAGNQLELEVDKRACQYIDFFIYTYTYRINKKLYILFI